MSISQKVFTIWYYLIYIVDFLRSCSSSTSKIIIILTYNTLIMMMMMTAPSLEHVPQIWLVMLESVWDFTQAKWAGVGEFCIWHLLYAAHPTITPWAPTFRAPLINSWIPQIEAWEHYGTYTENNNFNARKCL